MDASAQIEFDGKTLTLAQLGPYSESTDLSAIRKPKHVRQDAWNFFAANKEQFDTIYDKLVKLRHQIATKIRLQKLCRAWLCEHEPRGL